MVGSVTGLQNLNAKVIQSWNKKGTTCLLADRVARPGKATFHVFLVVEKSVCINQLPSADHIYCYIFEYTVLEKCTLICSNYFNP